MHDGDLLTTPGAGHVTDVQVDDLRHVVEKARTISGFAFAVYLGPLAEGRSSAVQQHGALPDPASSVLVALCPVRRVLEIVSGANVAVDLSNEACDLAAASMVSSFVAGDLVGGLRRGVIQLAEHARHPRVVHLDEPA